MVLEELISLIFMLTFKNLTMKTIKLLAFSFLALSSFSGCSPENDIENPTIEPFAFYQDFSSSVTEATADEPIVIEGWTNFAEAGTVKWAQGFYSDTKYAEFTAYQSDEASNIGWLISPPINMDLQKDEKLAFDVAQAYVGTSSNSIELLISTNYNGTDVLDATWQSVAFTRPPLDFDTNFDFFSSGKIDLSSYTGNIYIAFKYKGSGTNTSLDGTYSIDNIRIFNQK
jgi:hypothetical protein